MQIWCWTKKFQNEYMKLIHINFSVGQKNAKMNTCYECTLSARQNTINAKMNTCKQ